MCVLLLPFCFRTRRSKDYDSERHLESFVPPLKSNSSFRSSSNSVPGIFCIPEFVHVPVIHLPICAAVFFFSTRQIVNLTIS